jgi:uncharacterized protein (TIGR02145 family)
MKKLIRCLLIFLWTGMSFTYLLANNIQITNIRFAGNDAPEGYRDIEFNLQWENSWRTDKLVPDFPLDRGNWDAAWVFLKYRVDDSAWKHARLDISGHATGSGTPAGIHPGRIDENAEYHPEDNPVVGVLIHRNEQGSGTFTAERVRVRWNYGVDGVPHDAELDIKVFAIEMVLAAPGPFYLGSGGNELGRFHEGNHPGRPFRVTSNWDKTFDDSEGSLWGTSHSGSMSAGGAGQLHTNFPVGTEGFYVMKYSVSQQLYIDFLNTLTPAQANARFARVPNSRLGNDRSDGVYYTTLPFLPNTFMSWMDAAAFADWAGLRPMTELEFEKAARGPAVPVTNEYAWGTPHIAANAYTLVHPGEENEGISDGFMASDSIGNAIYQSTVQGMTDPTGPARVGIFAAHQDNTGRVSAGASYWGVMELSGNVVERVVTVGNETGRSFTGLHGDGMLTEEGFGNVADWPGGGINGITGAAGSGFRGGDWLTGELRVLRISGRDIAAFNVTTRTDMMGFRAARSIPEGSIPPPEPPEEGTVVDIEGNVYQTVQIGSQVWMSENLRTGFYSNGQPIPNVTNDSLWNTLQSGAWAHWGNDENYENPYGKLYNWYAASDYRGLCPEGWRVPRHDDWKVLEQHLGLAGWELDYIGNRGGAVNAGGKLKHAGTEYWAEPNTGATNETGFTALPASGRRADGSFIVTGVIAYFWDYIEVSENNAYYRLLFHNQGTIGFSNINKKSGYSVRCVME